MSYLFFRYCMQRPLLDTQVGILIEYFVLFVNMIQNHFLCSSVFPLGFLQLLTL